ncbi:hypothetical protein [Marinomonas sp. THO17]|uniref:hypothetical protein n=1 Tax=Marinomonas sp. THO17 TaxID=3149048 RepID=UPI00336C197A
MSIKQISLLFAAFFLTACQQTAVQPNGSTSPLDEDSALVADPQEQAEIMNFDGNLELASSAEVDAQEIAVITPVETLSPAEQTTPVQQPLTPAQQPLTPAQQLTRSLIEKGRKAYLADRLLTPEDDNANLYFQAALGRDPGNFDAIQGIAQIVETYTDWAWQKALQGQYVSAQKFLESASSVNPQDPLIDEFASRIADLRFNRSQPKEHKKPTRSASGQPTQDQISDHLAAEESANIEQTPGVFVLPKDLFTLSEDEILAKIQPIIEVVTATHSRLDINWPNDKQARLIYQIINSRTDFRVRAMIYHRARYNVELQQE